MLPEPFIRQTIETLGEQTAEKLFASLYNDTPVTSIRHNKQKISYQETVSHFGENIDCPITWCNKGFYLKERPQFSLDPLIHAGAYYVQEASSMYAGHIIESIYNDGDTILDLCAAPGGKSTHIASIISDESLLVCNEVIGSRATILAENMCKWGNNNVMVANCDPKDIGRLSGQFDIVVADVPCSGEGMFRKEPKSINEWSAESVQLCAARSRRIISDVWPSLKEGGYLLYSTCTFNHYENDDNIEWICNTLGAESVKCEKPIEAIETKYGIQFAPGHTRGEGFFCALIKKCSSSPSLRSPKPNRTKFIKSPLVKDGNLLLMKGDLLKAYPEHHINKIGIIEENIRIIRSGIAVASIKGKDTIPDHALAMSSILSEGQYPTIELSLEDALNYLRREPIKIDYQTKGYILVRYKNIALGFIKNLGNRCNNLYPQQYRLRM